MAPSPRITREVVLARLVPAFPGGVAPSMEEIATAAGVSRAALYGLFGSRAAILEAIGLDVPPSAQDRVLSAAAEVLAQRGLASLSLDEVAARSGVSRATVYRLYPGKAALFREVVRAYLPIDDALELMDPDANRPPAEVMGILAHGLAQAGYVRVGVLRSVLFEVMGRQDGTEEVLAEVLENTAAIARYLEGQMDGGRLRRMDPMLALQGFLAPIVLHVVSRPLIEEHGLSALSLEAAVDELTAAWLRAMAPPRSRRAAHSAAWRTNA